MKAAPNKSHFVFTRVKFLEQIIEGNTITYQRKHDYIKISHRRNHKTSTTIKQKENPKICN